MEHVPRVQPGGILTTTVLRLWCLHLSTSFQTFTGFTGSLIISNFIEFRPIPGKRKFAFPSSHFNSFHDFKVTHQKGDSSKLHLKRAKI